MDRVWHENLKPVLLHPPLGAGSDSPAGHQLRKSLLDEARDRLFDAYDNRYRPEMKRLERSLLLSSLHEGAAIRERERPEGNGCRDDGCRRQRAQRASGGIKQCDSG